MGNSTGQPPSGINGIGPSLEPPDLIKSSSRRRLVWSSCVSAWGEAEASLLGDASLPGEALLVGDESLPGDGLLCGLLVVLSGLLLAVVVGAGLLVVVGGALLLGEALLVPLVPP